MGDLFLIAAWHAFLRSNQHPANGPFSSSLPHLHIGRGHLTCRLTHTFSLPHFRYDTYLKCACLFAVCRLFLRIGSWSEVLIRSVYLKIKMVFSPKNKDQRASIVQGHLFQVTRLLCNWLAQVWPESRIISLFEAVLRTIAICFSFFDSKFF